MSTSSSERAMDSPSTFPATPGMALFPLSPARVNRLTHSPSVLPYHDRACESPPNVFGHPEFGIPGDFGSKSANINYGDDNRAPKSAFTISRDAPETELGLPGSPPKHARASADVHAMVSRFNSLDIKDHADLRRRDAAALKRAQMGREEAEAEVSRVRDEVDALRAGVDEAKERETRVAKRLDGVMEELHRAKETQAQSQSLYEKEIRKVRKEAFRSSSMLVKLQEELKTARNALRGGQSELELEKEKLVIREQEILATQQELVEVQEELGRAQVMVKAVRNDCDTLRMNLKEEEMQRGIAEGKLAVFAARDEENFFSDRKRQSLLNRESVSESSSTQESVLKTELETQTKKLAEAEAQIEFMKLECQFGCCSCQLAETQGRGFVHDGTYEAEVQMIKAAVAGMLTPPQSVIVEDGVEVVNSQEGEPANTKDAESPLIKAEPQQAVTHSIPQHCPMEPNNALVASANEAELSITQQVTGSDYVANHAAHKEVSIMQVSPATEQKAASLILPATPLNVRTFTTTTTVPLADHSSVDYSAFSTPTGLTREQAIEQLRQRRGRARSVASTPKKFLKDGFTPRRDVSAPDLRAVSNPRSVSRGRVRR